VVQNNTKKMKIVIIGSGNVGWHLGNALYEQGIHVEQVYSRQRAKAEALAQAIKTDYTTHLQDVMPGADLYILAVSDDAIKAVSIKLRRRINIHSDEKLEPLVVHTSGATPSTVLRSYFKNYGVFYPLQTFSMRKAVEFNTLPICVDSTNIANLDTLFRLAQSLSQEVYRINDDERKILHVAAVFVNNFTNYFYTIADDILQQEGIDFDILFPLIQETINKIYDHPPKMMQTGPAVRDDEKTIGEHLNYLGKYPDYQKVYDLITQNIRKS